MKPISGTIALSLAVIVTAAASLVAQRVPAKKPSFEVASIKPSTVLPALAEVLQQRSFSITEKLKGGRFVARAVTVRGLMGAAYAPVSAEANPPLEGQVVGGPAWIGTDFFDIEADSSQIRPEEAQLMLQSLLEDRFQLKYHREARALPVLSLAVAKGGHKLKLSDDQTPAPAVIDSARLPKPSFGQRGVTVSLQRPRGFLGITAKLSGQSVVSTALGTGVPISELVRHLESSLRRPVIDKTSLKGLFDITLTVEGPARIDSGGGPAAGASDPLSPSQRVSQEVTPLFASALEKQLGLKLEQVKGPLEVIVIDSISKPSAN